VLAGHDGDEEEPNDLVFAKEPRREVLGDLREPNREGLVRRTGSGNHAGLEAITASGGTSARRVVSFDSVPANHGNIFDEPNV
jgi:hypothetical protein